MCAQHQIQRIARLDFAELLVAEQPVRQRGLAERQDRRQADLAAGPAVAARSALRLSILHGRSSKKLRYQSIARRRPSSSENSGRQESMVLALAALRY